MPCLDGSLYTSARVPGGAKGVLLKLYSPSKSAQADKFSLYRTVRSRFRDISACQSSSHQSCNEKELSTVHSPTIKWFLNVWIASSAAFTLCLCGSTN